MIEISLHIYIEYFLAGASLKFNETYKTGIIYPFVNEYIEM